MKRSVECEIVLWNVSCAMSCAGAMWCVVQCGVLCNVVCCAMWCVVQCGVLCNVVCCAMWCVIMQYGKSYGGVTWNVVCDHAIWKELLGCDAECGVRLYNMERAVGV